MTNDELDELLGTLRKHGVNKYTFTDVVTANASNNLTIELGPAEPPADRIMLEVGKNLSADDIKRQAEEDLYAAVR